MACWRLPIFELYPPDEGIKWTLITKRWRGPVTVPSTNAPFMRYPLKLERFMLIRIRSIWRNLITGIENIIRWTPVIWKDRDFDDGYVIRLLYYKFKFMEQFLQSENAHARDAKKTAMQVMVAKNLCKRLWDQMYLSNALTNYRSKYGDPEIFHFEPSKTPGYDKLVLDWKTKQQEKEYKRASKHSRYMKNQDFEYLCTYLNKHFRSWWD